MRKRAAPTPPGCASGLANVLCETPQFFFISFFLPFFFVSVLIFKIIKDYKKNPNLKENCEFFVLKKMFVNLKNCSWIHKMFPILNQCSGNHKCSQIQKMFSYLKKWFWIQKLFVENLHTKDVAHGEGMRWFCAGLRKFRRPDHPTHCLRAFGDLRWMTQSVSTIRSRYLETIWWSALELL